MKQLPAMGQQVALAGALLVGGWSDAVHAQAATDLDGGPLGTFSVQQVAAVADLRYCVNAAAATHNLNPWVLAAVLRFESRLRADAIRTNTNGTVDVGIAQVNSVHWPELTKYGVSPESLLAPCVGTFVGGWLLSKHVRRFGNSWWAIGAYHSKTPSRNSRYQVGIWNELVDMGAVTGPKLRLQQQ